MTTRPINNTPIPCMPHAESEHVPTTPENSYHALARLLSLKTEKTYERETRRMQREPGWQPPITPPHTSVFVDKSTYNRCHRILDEQARRLRGFWSSGILTGNQTPHASSSSRPYPLRSK